MERIDFKKENIPFTQVSNSVLNDKNLSAKAKGLYAYLYSKPDGWDFAIDRIKKDFSDGRLSINNGLQELEQNGYLYRQRKETGRVVYLLKNQMSKIDIGEQEPNVENRKVRKPQSAKTDTISNKEIIVIKNYSNKDILFDQFWSIYPVKKVKKTAEQKWSKLNDKDKKAILEDIPKRIESDDSWIRGFIPHPTTYLNQERWNDEITTRSTNSHKIYVAE
jgi:hypothetical protein